MGDPNIHDIAWQIAVLEEEVEKTKSDLSATLDQFRADMARRDVSNTRWAIALVIGAVVVLGAFIRLLA